MAKNDAPAEKTSRLKQILSAYQLTKKSDPKVGLVLAGIFLGILAVFVLVGLLTGHLLILLPLGVAIAFLVVTIVFGRKVEKAAYSQIEGQAGAAPPRYRRCAAAGP